MTVKIVAEVKETQDGVLQLDVKGGAGSGNYGHAGRPGIVGGSSKRGGGLTFKTKRQARLYAKMELSEQRGKAAVDAIKSVIPDVKLDRGARLHKRVGQVSTGMSGSAKVDMPIRSGHEYGGRLEKDIATIQSKLRAQLGDDITVSHRVVRESGGGIGVAELTISGREPTNDEIMKYYRPRGK